MSMDPHLLDNLAPYRALKVAVIREEFMALIHDPMAAIVLNQLVYWSLRVKDFDLFLEEERQFNPACNVLPRHGWIYKTAEDLIAETMLNVSKSTMLRYLTALLEAKWLDKRSNPINKWDRTTQYRVNLHKLQEDLARLGYTLPGFCAPTAFPKDAPKIQNDRLMFQNETSRAQNETCSTEITTKNTNKDSSSSSCFSEAAHEEKFVSPTPFPSNSKQREKEEEEEEQKNEMREEVAPPLLAENLPEAMLEMWKNHIGQQAVQMTDARREQFTTLLMGYLQSDLTEWEALCERIKDNRYLMGDAPSGWRINLDWILNPINLLKVLENKIYAPKKAGEDTEESECLSETGETSPLRDTKIQAILETIQDPVWRKWCSQLDLSTSRWAVRLSQLEEISQARFIEVEDDRFVLVACPDKITCQRIEELRCPLLTVVNRTFPNIRAILPHVEEGETTSSSISATSNPTTNLSL